jgi:hypothetical protein
MKITVETLVRAELNKAILDNFGRHVEAKGGGPTDS